MQNEKGIGLFTSVTMLIGSMIGSAIFSLSGLTIYKAGPAAILSWVIAAGIMLIYGLICAELATIYPKSGGVFIFPAKALGKTEKAGKFWGWISTWGFINGNIVGIAFAAIYVATYLGAGFGFPQSMQIPMALITIAIAFVLNIVELTTTGKYNTVLVIGLVVCILAYSGIAFFDGKFDPSNFTPFFSQGVMEETGFLAVVPTAMIGYGAIVSVAFMVSEVKNPKKNIPRSAVIAMIIVTVVYVLCIVATLGLVSTKTFVDNPDLMFIPMFAASYKSTMAQIVSIAAIFALVTTMIILMAMTTRAIQAVAEDKLLPKSFAKNNKKGTPVVAAVVVSLAATGLSLFPRATETIVNFGALFTVTTIMINIFSLYAARKKNPYIEGNYRIPGGKVLPMIALVLIVVCYIPDIVSGGWKIWLFTILWNLIGVGIYKYYESRA